MEEYGIAGAFLDPLCSLAKRHVPQPCFLQAGIRKALNATVIACFAEFLFILLPERLNAQAARIPCG